MRELELGKKVALLTIECQNSQTDSTMAGSPNHAILALECERRQIVLNIRELSKTCRALGMPVIHNRVVHRPDWKGSGVNSRLLGSNRKHKKLIAGTLAVELNPGLGCDEEDFIVDRITGVTAFYGTGLDQILRNCGIETVIICGVSTNLGIPGATIEAVNRGYWVIIPEDCTAGTSQEIHDFTLGKMLPLLANVTSSGKLFEYWRA